jgi:PAS domain S-box-containing protein
MHTVDQIDFKKLFTSLPEAFVVLKNNPPHFMIIGASDGYLKVTDRKREDILGKNLFEAFPDNSVRAQKTGRGELFDVLEKCGKTGQSVKTGVIRYDIANEKGEYTIRYWQAIHHPITDDKGEVIAIIQNTEDISEMVEANARLKLNELQQENALATGLIGSWSWNLHEDLVIADKGLAKLFGINVDSAQRGMPIRVFMETIHKDDRAMVKQHIADALERGEKYESEYRTVDKKGNLHWVIARGKLEYDEQGEPVAFPGVIIDITARKEAENALRESERRLRFMADAMPQLVWTATDEGKNDYFNQQWYDYTGMQPDQPTTDVWERLIHPDDKAKIWKNWQRALKSEEPYEIESRLYHAESKSYRWVMTRAVPLKNDAGKVIKWYGTCTDIDDRKRSEAIQVFLAEASKELSTSLDYNETLKKVSKLGVPALADWCSVDLYDSVKGFSQVAVTHRNPKKVTLARQYRKHNPISIDDPTGVAKVVRTGESEFVPVIDMALVKKYVKGKEKLAFFEKLDLHSLMTVPIIVNNEPFGAISFVSSESRRHYTEADLSIAEELAARVSLSIANAKLYANSLKALEERHKLEKELQQEKEKLEQHVQERTRQLQKTNDGLHKEIVKRQSAEKELHAYSKELARSNQELQDFAYVSSHDLQEPLRKIQAFGNLLESEYGDKLGDGLDYLVRMQGAASRMSTLIQDLLAFSRVSTQPNTRTDVDLNAVIADVVSDLEMRVADTKATVKIGKMPHVIADPTHMRQLFQNLIGNALKFHQPDVLPVVEVSTVTTKQYHEIRVKDNGIGFDVKYLDRIFAVFQRLHGREAYEGTGIGLAVCRKIVERYNGTITAESQKNSGSVFIVRLPIGGGGHKI